jgi:serine/threonine-protein kinase HipA
MTNPKMIKKLFNMTSVPTIALSLQEIPRKAQDMAGKMSISGVQPKLLLKLRKQQAELVPTASGGEYILKPQVAHFPHIPENENCCMDIAWELGIHVPPHCLLVLRDGSLAYVIKRFDRKGKKKIHQEDFYQILGKRDKYEGSLEEVGGELKKISSVPGLDGQLFFERVVFNFLAGNGDGHFKNYSISYDENGDSRLSPAYDIVCSKLVLPTEEDSALTLNGRKNKLKRRDFDALAEYLKIPEKVRYEKFTHQWGLIKQLVEISELSREDQNRFLDIIQSRYQRLEIVS